MKLRIVSIAALFTTLIVAIPMVQAFDWSAPYNSLSSGYRVTTDVHGQEIPPGTLVTAWAGTTNLDIDEVKFRWMDPDGGETIVAVTSFTMGEWEGQDVKEFSDQIVCNIIGDWGVQGVFYDDDATGSGEGPIKDQPGPIQIRARSFHAVPEVTIGTIAAVLAMFGAFGLFAVKKKRISINPSL